MNTWRIIILFGSLIYVNTTFAIPSEIDKVAVIVNDSIILESDIKDLIESMNLHLRHDVRSISDNNLLRDQSIERLISDRIQTQMIQKTGVSVSDSDLDSAIANIAAQNKMNTNQLRNYLSYEGLNYNTYRSQIRKEMLIAAALNNEVRRRVTILPEEVEVLSKIMRAQNDSDIEINISHILLPLSENPSREQLETAELLVKKLIGELHNGADFRTLAIAHTRDFKSIQSWTTGWYKSQEIPKFFSNYLINDKKNYIVGPIRSRFGFHILKVNDIRKTTQSVSETEVHVRHILLKPSMMMTDDQASAKLASLAEDIKRGRTKFADEAKELSQDEASALQGGDLGWIPLDTYDSVFRDILLNLNKGEISVPLKSAFGWHLIELLDTRKSDKSDVTNKNRAYHVLFSRKFAEEMQIVLQELRAQAYVRILYSHA